MAEYFYKEGDEYKKVDDALHTQADVDKVVESRLERERKKFADYDTLKETAGKVETIKSEYEDKLKAAGTEKSELEGKLKSAQLETDKGKIIHEFKLPDDAAEFLTGETAEDIRKGAEKLSKIAPGGKVVIKKDPKPGENDTDSKKIAKSLFGSKD